MPITTVRDLYLHFLSNKSQVLIQAADGGCKRLTRDSFSRIALGLAKSIQDKGVTKGDIIATCAYNSVESLAVDCALFMLGAIVVPLHENLSAQQTTEILDDCNPKYIITTRQKAEILNTRNTVAIPDLIEHADSRISHQYPQAVVNESDLALIIYTSGTTGSSKGVMLTHKNIMSNVTACAEVLPINDRDTFFSFLPFSHAFERIVDFIALYKGATLAYPSSLDNVRAEIKTIRPTVTAAVPRFFEKAYENISAAISSSSRLVRSTFNKTLAGERLNPAERLIFRLIRRRILGEFGGRIRFFVSGGAALSPELQTKLHALGFSIIQGYGLTEASPVVSVNRLEENRIGSVGKALPGVEVKLSPDNELLVKGDNVMAGYFNKTSETREVLEDGWLRTGDIASIDKDGFITIVGRKKELFKTSTGKYVAPAPIEAKLRNLPGVTEAVLIGDGKKFVSAIIITETGRVSEAELEATVSAINATLSSSEQIKKYKILHDTVPQALYTPTMKLKRRLFEERYKTLIEEIYNTRMPPAGRQA